MAKRNPVVLESLDMIAPENFQPSLADLAEEGWVRRLQDLVQICHSLDRAVLVTWEGPAMDGGHDEPRLVVSSIPREL